MAVPVDLRQIFRRSELTKALDTSDVHVAVPRSLRLAAKAKQLFFEARNMIIKKQADDGDIITDYILEVWIDDHKRTRVKIDATPEESANVMAMVSHTVNALNSVEAASKVVGAGASEIGLRTMTADPSLSFSTDTPEEPKFRRPLKDVSMAEIEAAFADALLKLTGQDFRVDIGSMVFEQTSMRRYDNSVNVSLHLGPAPAAPGKDPWSE